MSDNKNTGQKPQDPDAPNPRLIRTIRESGDEYDRIIRRQWDRDQLDIHPAIGEESS